jgi:hypothetical protein
MHPWSLLPATSLNWAFEVSFEDFSAYKISDTASWLAKISPNRIHLTGISTRLQVERDSFLGLKMQGLAILRFESCEKQVEAVQS